MFRKLIIDMIHLPADEINYLTKVHISDQRQMLVTADGWLVVSVAFLKKYSSLKPRHTLENLTMYLTILLFLENGRWFLGDAAIL